MVDSRRDYNFKQTKHRITEFRKPIAACVIASFLLQSLQTASLGQSLLSCLEFVLEPVIGLNNSEEKPGGKSRKLEAGFWLCPSSQHAI